MCAVVLVLSPLLFVVCYWFGLCWCQWLVFFAACLGCCWLLCVVVGVELALLLSLSLSLCLLLLLLSMLSFVLV